MLMNILILVMNIIIHLTRQFHVSRHQTKSIDRRREEGLYTYSYDRAILMCLELTL